MSKTASIPFLWIDPELRRAAEDVLRDGESLSSFVEQALQVLVDCRGDCTAGLARLQLEGCATVPAGAERPAVASRADVDDRPGSSDATPHF